MSSFINMLVDGYHWIFFTGVVLLAFCAVRDSLFRGKDADKSLDAVEILKIRLARGEISEEDYLHKIDLIQPHRPMYS